MELKYFVIVCIFLSGGCQTKPILNTQELYTQDFIEIGNGGGFTGLYTYYYIDKQGVVYQKLPSEDLKPVATLLSSFTNQVWAYFQNNVQKNIEISDPGNFNYILNVSMDHNSSKFTFRDGSDKVSQAIKTQYNNIMASINRQLNRK